MCFLQWLIGSKFVVDLGKQLLASGRIVLLLSSRPLSDPGQRPTLRWLHISLVYRSPYDIDGLYCDQVDPPLTDPIPPYPARAFLHAQAVPFQAWDLFEDGLHSELVLWGDLCK